MNAASAGQRDISACTALNDGSQEVGAQSASHFINVKVIYQLRGVVKGPPKKNLVGLSGGWNLRNFLGLTRLDAQAFMGHTCHGIGLLGRFQRELLILAFWKGCVLGNLQSQLVRAVCRPETAKCESDG